MVIDGLLDDWSEADRLDTAQTGNPAWQVYGKVADGQFYFALRSLNGVAIGAGTTFWLNTDRNASTGYQIFGNTGGAEYNINVFTDGKPYLYTGADGQNFVSGPVQYAYGANSQTLELAVPIATVGSVANAADVLIDVNNNVFLPGSYAGGGYTVAPPKGSQPSPTVGPITLDGNLSDWTSADRIDLPGTRQTGYELYGRYVGDTYVVAISSAVAVGANTTIWLNTDRNAATGYQIFGTTGGAEYNVNFGNNGLPALYTGSAGQTFVSQIASGTSSDHKIVEFAIPKSALAGTPSAINMLLDINDQAFLPNDYGSYQYTIKDQSTLPPIVNHGVKVGIVFSESSAKTYFSATAYSQLFMAAQNQAAMAGVPFDLLTESDLTDIAKISQYKSLIFPSMSSVALDKVAAITDTLTDAVYHYGVGLVTAGNFLTNDATGALLPGDPYARMKGLLGLTREDGANAAAVKVEAGDISHPVMAGYTAGEDIRDYPSLSTSWFKPVDVTATTLATQTTGGATHSAVLATQTGGNNVHFANENLLADNNMLGHALDWSAGLSNGPSVSLKMSRQSALFASRTDMDQSQQSEDVSPESGGPGIYDKLLPILAQWKADYNFVGSYYLNIGNNPPDETTDWTRSLPYYQQILALGNEIGTHSYTHPEDTNVLTPAQIQFEFEQSKLVLQQKLGISVTGAAVPGAPETIATARMIDPYFSYISGGASLAGAGYPGAIGYLTPGDKNSVYIAPDTSFDFTLVDFQHKTVAQASEAWAAEWAALKSHAELPVVVWPWHDYGPTAWPTSPPTLSPYNAEMFTSFIQTAYQAGTEFVTLNDLAQRVAAFDQSTLDFNFNATSNVITATVGSGAAGKFALDLEGGAAIRSVANWYAYDADSVFVAKTGGTYTINLGPTPDDVTHITALPSRSDLISVTGDGTKLAFSVVGEGSVLVDLVDPAGRTPHVTGATIKSLNGDKLELTLSGTGSHDVTVDFSRAPVLAHAVADQTTNQNAPFAFALPQGTFTDDPGDTLTYAATLASGAALPGWLHFDAATQTLSGTPLNADVGTLSLKVAATDLSGASTSDIFALTVVNINDAPTLAVPIPDATATEGAPFSLTLAANTFADIDVGDTLRYTATLADGSALPSWLGFDAVAERFSGTPPVGSPAILSLKVTATDSGGLTASDIFDVAIAAKNLVLTGTAGNDTLIGRRGNDTLNGLAGNDVLDGGAGADTMTGGAGNDTYVVDNVGDRVIEGAGGGTDLVRTTLAAYALPANVENLIFTGTGDFSGAGNNLANAITGGAGNDLLDGGLGADILTGGLGNDTYVVDNVGDRVVEAAGAGIDTVRSSISYVLPAEVENLILTGIANLQGTGNALDNTITGNAGNNLLDGGAGADTMIGGAGNDTYIVDHPGDLVIEAAGQGTDIVCTQRRESDLHGDRLLHRHRKRLGQYDHRRQRQRYPGRGRGQRFRSAGRRLGRRHLHRPGRRRRRRGRGGRQRHRQDRSRGLHAHGERRDPDLHGDGCLRRNGQRARQHHCRRSRRRYAERHGRGRPPRGRRGPRHAYRRGRRGHLPVRRSQRHEYRPGDGFQHCPRRQACGSRVRLRPEPRPPPARLFRDGLHGRWPRHEGACGVPVQQRLPDPVLGSRWRGSGSTHLGGDLRHQGGAAPDGLHHCLRLLPGRRGDRARPRIVFPPTLLLTHASAPIWCWCRRVRFRRAEDRPNAGGDLRFGAGFARPRRSDVQGGDVPRLRPQHTSLGKVCHCANFVGQSRLSDSLANT
jgi:serralysin